MKVHIINHRCGDDEIEVKNGIRVFDWVGNEFIINLNNFGELEINGLNEGLCIIPKYGNQIVIKDAYVLYGMLVLTHLTHTIKKQTLIRNSRQSRILLLKNLG